MDNNASRQTALVTGAAGVLGEAIARRLHRDGHAVALADIDENRLQAISTDLGDGSLPLPVDISNADAVKTACEYIRQHLGPIGILVNNAGILSNNKAAETDDAEWRRVLAINLDGSFYASRACLPSMKTVTTRQRTIVSCTPSRLSAVCGRPLCD